MKIKEIICEMTLGQAQEVFNRLGYQPGDDLKSFRNRFAMLLHPDHSASQGYSPEQAQSNEKVVQLLNQAYDILIGKTQPEASPRPTVVNRPDYADTNYYGPPRDDDSFGFGAEPEPEVPVYKPNPRYARYQTTQAT